MPSNNVKSNPDKTVRERKGHGKTITIFSAIILAVIVVTFIGAPVVSKVTEQPSVVFGTYDGAPIEFFQGNYFAQRVEQLNRFYEQYNQGNNNNVDLQRQFVWRQAFQQSALQTAFKKESENAGIVITENQVDKMLVNHPAYQRDGKFSEEIYRNTPASEKFKYRQETKTELQVQQYTNDHSESVLVSDQEKNFLEKMAYPQRKFSFITFTDADYSDALVTEYAAKNKNLFRTINLSRITVSSSEGDASKIRDEAVKNEKSFEDLAKTYSKDALAETGGALNNRYYYELKSDFDKVDDLDKLFKMTKGEISAVFKKANTWTIYKVIAPSTDPDTSKPEILSTARAYIVKNDRGLLEDYLEAKAKEFKTKLTDPKKFAEEAKKIGKNVETSNFVALNFGNLDLFAKVNAASQNSVFQSLAANEDFYKKAFKLQKDGISDPILASPAVLLLKVDDIKEGPVVGDTPFNKDSIDRTFQQERNQVLQQTILDSPRFKDDFNAQFAKLFPKQ